MRRQPRGRVAWWVSGSVLFLLIILVGYARATLGYFPTAPADLLGTLAVLNPLRDREPERLGEELLARVRSGQCREALVERGLSPDMPCAREEAWPLAIYRLVGRSNTSTRADLQYRATRRDARSGRVFDSSASVVVDRDGGSWRVFMYSVTPQP